MKIRLNLATAPLENHRRFLLGAALVGALALAALGMLSRDAYRDWRASSAMRAEISDLQSGIRSLRSERGELEDFFKSSATRQVLDRSAFLNSLIEQRSFPWTKIFMDLENRLPEGVRVVSIAPRMQEGRVQVKLVVGATGDEGKLKFLKILEEAPEFSRIQVISETRPERAEQGDRVLLELVAWYASL